MWLKTHVIPTASQRLRVLIKLYMLRQLRNKCSAKYMNERTNERWNKHTGNKQKSKSDNYKGLKHNPG